MRRIFGVVCGVIAVEAILFTSRSGNGQTQMRKPSPLVRIAELEIDPHQLAEYKNALSEEIATSVRDEPGVLNLYAVAVKGQPNQVRIFELYKDQAAYESHLQSQHFKKYKGATQGMVKSLKLIETEPILLGAK